MIATRVNLILMFGSIFFIAFAVACNDNATSSQSADQSAACTGSAGQAHTAAEATHHHPHQPVASDGPAASIPDFTFYILKSGIRFTKENLAKTGNIVFI